MVKTWKEHLSRLRMRQRLRKNDQETILSHCINIVSTSINIYQHVSTCFNHLSASYQHILYQDLSTFVNLCQSFINILSTILILVDRCCSSEYHSFGPLFPPRVVFCGIFHNRKRFGLSTEYPIIQGFINITRPFQSWDWGILKTHWFYYLGLSHSHGKSLINGGFTGKII